jgi:serine protease AprX
MSPAPSCPLCLSDVGPGAAQAAQDVDPEIQLLILHNNPWWRPDEKGGVVCQPCVDGFADAARAFRAQFPSNAHGPGPILPTAVRLGACDPFRGRGVTIAFLDSGFYAHPDLVEPEDRILAYVDVTNPRARRRDLATPELSSWHGMMTSVVAAGNGRLSDGLYRGLASEARLVLVKCGTARRIRHDDIRRGLEWVIRNRRRYGIRVVNVSCGGDYEASYLRDGLSRAADDATRAGLLVVAAAGNRGHEPRHPVLPPASAPSVLTVGGLDDKNRLAFAGYDIYHSSYGPTVDGLQKPEVIAPGICVAAPILPGTPTAEQASLLARLAAAPDDRLAELIASSAGVDASLDEARHLASPLLRELVAAKLRDNNVISGAYKHVDGTSFAAPIVSSIAARMLEANPGLTPQESKLILMTTARRLPHVEVERQGSGTVDPRAAIAESVRLGALQARTGLPEKRQGRLSAPLIND